jgi:gliding motility-associated lipoprotein GldH
MMISAMMKFFLFCALLLAMFMMSCTDAAYFEQNKAISNRSWAYSDVPEFAVHIDDSTATYDVYVLLHQAGSKLLDTAYRAEITLAELDGRWLGQSAGTLYELQYLAHQNFVFPDTGIYTFAIEQNMRQNPLKDVADVGIKLVKK